MFTDEDRYNVTYNHPKFIFLSWIVTTCTMNNYLTKHDMWWRGIQQTNARIL